MTDHRSIRDVSTPGAVSSLIRPRYRVERDAESGRWFVFDAESPKKWRFPCPYTIRELAESFADRANAIEEGEPNSVIEDLRADADRLRGLIK